MNKISKFVKDHKKEILACTAGIVIGGCAYAIGIQCKSRILKSKKLVEGIVEMPGFDFKDRLTIADIGKLGEEFMKHYDVLTKDTEILEVGSFVFK